jgi:hypothetical protein
MYLIPVSVSYASPCVQYLPDLLQHMTVCHPSSFVCHDICKSFSLPSATTVRTRPLQRPPATVSQISIASSSCRRSWLNTGTMTCKGKVQCTSVQETCTGSAQREGIAGQCANPGTDRHPKLPLPKNIQIHRTQLHTR